MFKWLRTPRAEPPPEAPPARDLSRLLHRLEWVVRRKLDGQIQGPHRNWLRGSGVELADLREYRPEDDVRRIDWPTTARLQTPYVRDYHEDREMTAWLVLDLSASMAVDSVGRSKQEVVLTLCGLLTRLLHRQGNPVGLLLHNGSQPGFSLRLPPRVGRTALLRLLQAIAEPHTAREGHATDLGLLLRETAANLKRRCTVILVSDFYASNDWSRALTQLAQRHDVVAVRVRDPIELNWPRSGMMWLRDAETQACVWVDSDDAAFAQRFAQAAEAREAALRQAFVRAGVDALEVRTDEPVEDALLAFLRQRTPRPVAQATGGA
ncbi:MAG: DUF58 domain-containing protein [Limnohabitans sp.]|jgi:uncharacterized protein (DUF58 family)|nr:DUF58 domain-containing protein [Limnohabitans sp.]